MIWKKELSRIIECVLLIVLIGFNFFKAKYIIDESLINTALTLTSILFGFLISSICNLFGRKITKQMDNSNSMINLGNSQLHDLKQRFLRIINRIMVIVIICILYFLIKGFNVQQIIYVQKAAYIASIIFIFLLFDVLYLTYKEVKILLNLLINENRI